MKARLNKNHILIKLEDVTRKGNLYLPETAKEMAVGMATKGEVVAIGKECTFVKVGDRVHWKNYIGNSVEDSDIGEGIYVIVAEDDILLAI